MKEERERDMNPLVYVPVKVLTGKKMEPNKEALEFFVDQWINKCHKQPFQGEYNLPATNDTKRLLTIDPSQISHCICDIRMDTYDPAKATVMMGVRFSGPAGDRAADEFIGNNIRLVARCVKVKEGNKEVDRIVTWDCMHRPAGAPKKSLIAKKKK